MNEEHERARQIFSLTAIAAIILLIVVLMASCIPATYGKDGDFYRPPVCDDYLVGHSIDSEGERVDYYEFQCR